MVFSQDAAKRVYNMEHLPIKGVWCPTSLFRKVKDGAGTNTNIEEEDDDNDDVTTKIHYITMTSE